MPSTPPMGRPTIGTMKKPTTAPATPSHTVALGAPAPLARRFGTMYPATVAATARPVITAKATTPTAPNPRSSPYTSPAPQTSEIPGTSGTIVPTAPTAITSPSSGTRPVTAQTSRRRTSHRGDRPRDRRAAPSTGTSTAAYGPTARWRAETPYAAVRLEPAVVLARGSVRWSP